MLCSQTHQDFPGGTDSEESVCDEGNLSLFPGLGRSPGGGHGNPLRYSCLENRHGQRSLAGCSPWGCKELDTTERLSTWAPTPKGIDGNPNLKGDGIRRWGLWEVTTSPNEGEGVALLLGSAPFLKGSQKATLSLLPCEDRVRMCCLWTREKALTRYWICPHLNLGLPSLQTHEK